MDLALTDMPAPDTVMDVEAQRSLLDAVCGVPNGVLAMSPVMPGMVETSTNLAFGQVRRRTVWSRSRPRSARAIRERAGRQRPASVESVPAARRRRRDVVRTAIRAGRPTRSRRLLAVATAVPTRSCSARKPLVRSIHAGLECGLFLQEISLGLEMVSVRSDRFAAFTRRTRRLEIASVGRVLAAADRDAEDAGVAGMIRISRSPSEDGLRLADEDRPYGSGPSVFR